MSKKDPAVLFYIDNWLVSTKEMKADERGWYLNLILHQYDKGDLPNEIEELANLADVRFSEYEQFKQKWEQVLKHKFKQNDKGRLENATAKEILKNREIFKEKRTLSGIIGYVIKVAIRDLGATPDQVDYLKSTLDFENLDIKNKQMLEQVLKQTIKLYINGNGNININNKNSEKDIKGGVGEKVKTWRDDFSIYKSELDVVYNALIVDQKFIKEREEFNPNLDIVLSLKKAYTDFWSTEKGWKYKKKQKSKNNDWKSTLTNAIEINRVCKTRPRQTYDRGRASVDDYKELLITDETQVEEYHGEE